MSLVELMVAIAIGALIVTAMAILFANNSRSRGETERASRQIENGRYALEVLRGELFHAGYLAEFDPRLGTPSGLVLPNAMPDPCAFDLASNQTAMGVYIQGIDNIAAGTLGCLSDVKVGTDVVVIRRAGNCTVANPAQPGCTGVAAGAMAFQASSCNSPTELGSVNATDRFRLNTNLASLTLKKRNCTDTAEIHRYIVRIYYVANNDKAGDGIPTLKVRELGAGTFLTAASLVQGVENLQMEYGLDTDGNGDADVYTADPSLYLGCNDTTTPTCVGHWTSVVSAKAFVLSRGIEPSPDHADAKTYILGRKADGQPNQFSGLEARYKRRVFQEVVRLHNPSGRRGL